MIQVHLASVCQTQVQNVYTLCLKCPDRPDYILPVIATADMAGMLFAAQRKEVPSNLMYDIVNNLLTKDGYYIAGVEVQLTTNKNKITETDHGIQYLTSAVLLRQKGFQSEQIKVNAAEGIVFAYIYEYPLFVNKEMIAMSMPVDNFFNEKTSKEEFINGILQNRRGIKLDEQQ